MTENEQAILKGLRAADERDQLRSECSQMRDDITALVQRAEKAEAEWDVIIQTLSKALGYPWVKDGQQIFHGTTILGAEGKPQSTAETIAMEAERDAALGQVAALRGKLADIAVRAKRGEANCWSASDECGYAEIQRMAFPTLSDTAAAAAAYEARIRADERRKVLERIAEWVDIRIRWTPCGEVSEAYSAVYEHLMEQLATLESEGV